MKVAFTLNNRFIVIDVDPKERVVDLLREDLHHTGTKEGCGEGECGACTILVDGENRLSCLMLAPQLEGRHIITIEGIAGTAHAAVNGKSQTTAEDNKLDENDHMPILHPIQESFISHGAIQCGFCTPGMILATVSFLSKNSNPDKAQIRKAISGNLCRCTGYQKIVEAIDAAAHSVVTGKDAFENDNLQNVFKKQDLNFYHSHANPLIPETLDELFNIMKELPDAILYAGGTDILAKAGVSDASIKLDFICLERIKQMKVVHEDIEGNVFIGSCCTHNQLISNSVIQKEFPVLVKALESLGSPPIRNMGTIGGNICTASPAGDSLPPLFTLNAEVDIRSKHESRRMFIKDFILGPGKTALRKGEILYGIWIKKDSDYDINHFEKLGQRKALAISIASFTAIIKTTERGIIEKAHFAWGSVGPTVVTSEEIDSMLAGRFLTEETLKSLIPVIKNIISPINDIRASAAYRRYVAVNLIFRLLG